MENPKNEMNLQENKECLPNPIFIRALEFAEEINQFRLRGPTDDTDVETVFVHRFKHVAKRFVNAARKIPNQEFQHRVKELDLNISYLTDVYDLHSDLTALIDDLRELAKGQSTTEYLSSEVFISSLHVDKLREIEGKYDLSRIIRFCEEINSCYQHGNLIAVMLLLRSLLNHVPILFGYKEFSQFVSQSTKSIKDLLSPLEEEARKIADSYAHTPMRHHEPPQTKETTDPFKARVDFLIQQIIMEATKTI